MTQLPDMDGRLFYAVKCALGRLPVTAYDLKKVKVLDQFGGNVEPRYENLAAQVVYGDFSAISNTEGNFFINLEDLKKCDFSRVLYTWDCC